MRRAVLGFLGTVTALVMLLSFKTHQTSQAAAPEPVTSTPTASGNSSASSGGSSGSSGGSAGGSAKKKSSQNSSKSTSSKSTASNNRKTTSTKKSTGKASASSSASSSSADVTKSITGDAENTPYGPIQVRVTVTNGKIADVTATEYPGDPRSQQINAYALPVLTREAVAADSAKIDMVSGATYTSNGYIASLQSALDQLGN